MPLTRTASQRPPGQRLGRDADDPQISTLLGAVAVVAAAGAAVAALAAAVAVGGFRVGSVAIPPAVYGLALVPGVVAVALGRRPAGPAPITVPPRTGLVLKFAGFALVFVVLAAKQVPDGVAAGITTGAALGVVALGTWWPLPTFLRSSVALAALALARPDADPKSQVPALLVMGGAAAIALVASSRLAAAAAPVLGGVRARPRGRRLAGEAAFVVLALLLGAVVASRLDSQRPPPTQARPGDEPSRQQPDPLAYQDTLDPNQAGARQRGGDPDEILLKVQAEQAGVLRAVTFDQWDGARWRRSAAIATGQVVRTGAVPVFSEGFETFNGRLSEQRVRIEAPYAAVAVGTPRVYYYDLPTGGRPEPDGTVRLEPALGRGAVYTAQSSPTDAGPGELRGARAGFGAGGLPSRTGRTGRPGDGAIPGVDGNPNLAAAPPLSDRARALAERVTAGAATDFDKVAALTAYLDASVAVGDDAGALPAGADPVDNVLFGGEATSPERLATTLAVLTRAVGLPSRLALGFLPGRRPFFGGDFVVRGRDAHAWVEVPFAGIGWQRFDPTGRIAAAEQQDSLWSRFRRAWERFWPLMALVAALVVAAVARRLVLRRRRLAAVPWATRYFARLVRTGTKRGRPRRPAETPAEYAAALAGGVMADERLVEVGHVVTAAAWSGRQPAATTQEWAEQVLAEAAKASGTGRARRRLVVK